MYVGPGNTGNYVLSSYPFMNLLERPLGETPLLMGRSKCEASYGSRADFFEF